MSKWRVIGLETHDAFMNMALDEAACDAVKSAQVAPTIRFYRWNPSAVSIGYFQSLDDEVATDICGKKGVDVVRRRTGGGAVYHDYDGEVTYSVIAPESIFPRGIGDSYLVICGWIVDSLARLGIKSEFKPINDIVISDSSKKVSGNAQTRRNGVILQHGTILYKVDVRKMFSLLKVGQEKIADKMIAAVEERVTSLHNLNPKLEMNDVYEAMVEGFTEGKSWDKGEWTIAELQQAQQLFTERYNTERWNGMR